jgi:hypothetical protein
LDPGEHTVLLDARGFASAERRVTLREGERERRVELTFVPLTPEEPPAREVPLAHEASPAVTERPIPTLAYVLGIGGLVLAGTGAYFQASGMGKRSDLYTCAPHCRQADVDSAERTLWAGNLVLAASALALAGAAWLYLTRPTVARVGASFGSFVF